MVFVFVTTLGLGIALPLLILHGNHANASSQVGGVTLTADSKSGRALFGEHCAVWSARWRPPTRSARSVA